MTNLHHVAVGNTTPADVIAVLETMHPLTPAHEGRAPVGVTPPFVAVWPLEPVRHSEGLATEDAGVFLDVYQLNCFGDSPGQAQALARRVTGLAWGSTWHLDEYGPCIPDETDKPAWWFVPLTWRSLTQARPLQADGTDPDAD